VEPEDFQIVLPISEIQSTVLWDWESYALFLEAEAMPSAVDTQPEPELPPSPAPDPPLSIPPAAATDEHTPE
jgi:hypothetical protein